MFFNLKVCQVFASSFDEKSLLDDYFKAELRCSRPARLLSLVPTGTKFILSAPSHNFAACSTTFFFNGKVPDIDANAFARIAPRVGRSYHLKFDPSTNATYVVDGYFWE